MVERDGTALPATPGDERYERNSKAFEELLARADSGDVDAIVEAAKEFDQRPVDRERAVHYLELAAMAGDVQSQTQLGSFFADELGPPDVDEALRWYRQAAEGGSADAAVAAGDIERDRQNLEASRDWYLTAARSGYEPALRRLVEHYRSVRNYNESRVWQERLDATTKSVDRARTSHIDDWDPGLDLDLTWKGALARLTAVERNLLRNCRLSPGLNGGLLLEAPSDRVVRQIDHELASRLQELLSAGVGRSVTLQLAARVPDRRPRLAADSDPSPVAVNPGPIPGSEDLISAIRRGMDATKMTQRDLADVLRVSESSVSRWMTGQAIPSELSVAALEEVLGIEIAELAAQVRPRPGEQADTDPAAFATEARGTATGDAEPARTTHDVGPAGLQPPEFLLANVANDFAGSRDYLGISADARAMAALLASKQLDPPLAVGLYGDWGSGKTFFMKRVEENITQLASSDTGRDAFHSKIGHVWFNAWHYAEGNLWASLLHHIFTTLYGAEDAREQALKLAVSRVDDARALAAVADARVGAAEERVRVARADVETAEDRREEALKAAEALRTRDVWEDIEITAEDSGLLSQVQEAAKQLGLPELGHSSADLWRGTNQILTLTQRARVLATAGKTWWKTPLWAALVVLLVIAGATWAFSILAESWNTWSGTATLVVGQLTSLAAAGATWVGRQSAVVKGLLAPAERLHALLESRKAAVELQFEVELTNYREELQAAEADRLASQEALRVALAEKAEARLEQTEMTGTRLLRRFLEERANSADYRQYLGVVALARRDLMDLQSHLKAALDDTAGERDLERIVLYIDDLDRCDPERVADVLDAIHLMLALPLFVVVVGVSPTWLERSLEMKHPDMLKGNSEVPSSTSAANYLEKIFQLTYSLRPLNSIGAEHLLEGLARNAGTVALSANDRIEARVDPAEFDDADSERFQDLSSGRAPHSTDAELTFADPEVVRTLAAALTLSDREIDLLRAVAPLVSSSPRRVQRFLNLYMVLRARGNDDDVLIHGDGLLLATALAVGMGQALSRMIDASPGPNDDLPIISALSGLVAKGSDEHMRWVEFKDRSLDAFDDLTVEAVRIWLVSIWSYVPISFQPKLPWTTRSPN